MADETSKTPLDHVFHDALEAAISELAELDEELKPPPAD